MDIQFPFPVHDMFIDPCNAENDGKGNYVYITPQYVVAHEVACPADVPAPNFIKNANIPNAPANFHEIVDVNGVYRALPVEKGRCALGWHCLYHGNRCSFGIEMAHYTNRDDFMKAYQIYCARHAYWLLVNGWDISHLKTHQEMNGMFPQDHGDHTDPVGYFASFGISIQQFKSDVQQWMQKLKPKEEYKMTVEDANKIIAILGGIYNAGLDKDEVHRLANELRKASNQPVQN
jgi:N-acetylmuramoyl-L-alanine amidase CwlA